MTNQIERAREVVEQLRRTFQGWLDAGPDDQPRHKSGIRPFSTGDLKHFVAGLDDAIATLTNEAAPAGEVIPAGMKPSDV